MKKTYNEITQILALDSCPRENAKLADIIDRKCGQTASQTLTTYAQHSAHHIINL